MDLSKIDLNSFQSGEEDPLQSTMSEAVKVNPDSQAKLKKLSRDSGVPTEAVAGDPGMIESSLNLKKIDLGSMTQRSPETAKFLTSFDNASVAHDDVSTLEKVESYFKKPTAPAPDRVPELRAVDRTMIEQLTAPFQRGVASFKAAANVVLDQVGLDFGLEKQIEQQYKAHGIEYNPKMSAAVRTAALQRGVEAYPLPEDVAKGMVDIQKAETFGEAFKAMIDNPHATFEMVVQSAGTTVPAMAASAAAAPFGGVAFGVATGMGSAFIEYGASVNEALQDHGVDLNDPLQIETALSDPALMATAKEKAIKRGVAVGAFDAFTAGIAGKLLAHARPTTTSVVARSVGELGIQAGGGMAGEATAQALTGEFKPADILLEGLAEGFTGPVDVAMNIHNELSKVREVETALKLDEVTHDAEQGKIDNITEAVKNSKLKQRDSESFREYMQQVAPDTDVFFDAEKVGEYLATLSQDQIAADPGLVKLQEQLQQDTSQADIAIPAADFSTDVVGSQHFEALRPHMKMSAESSTQFRVEQDRAEAQKYVESLMEQADKSASEYADAQDIYQQVKDQLVETGAVSPTNAGVMAQLVPAWATAQAKERGIPVRQVYEESGLRIEGPMTGRPAPGEAPAAPGEAPAAPGEAPAEEIPVHPLGSPGLSPENRKIENEAFKQVEENTPALIEEYFQKHGNLIDPDAVKTLFPAFVKDPSLAAAVHEPSSMLSKMIFTEALKRSDSPGITFTAGGGGSGKSEAMNIAVAKAGVNPEDLVFDSTLSSFNSAKKKIDEALQAGKEVAIVYTNRDVEKAFDFAMQRSRVVPIEVLAKAHVGASDTLRQLQEHYADNPLVDITVIENNGDTLDEIDIGTLDNVPQYEYGTVIRRLNEQADEALAAGKIDEARRMALSPAEKPQEGAAGVQGKEQGQDPSGPVQGEEQDYLSRFDNEPGTQGYYSPANDLIRLTKAANLSTFLHEFAHFMYEMELRNPNSKHAPQILQWARRSSINVAKDANRLPEAGINYVSAENVIEYVDNGTTGFAEFDDLIQTAIHEQFARGFETYLMEGKAPSIELRNVFRTFARWLTQIYKSVRGDLQVDLDSEIRQVFDRLLATEEQIEMASARARIEPMFTDATMAGMTEEEFAKYQAKAQGGKDKASETLRDKLIKQLRRQTESWWNEEKADIVEEEKIRLAKEPAFNAIDKLKNGKMKLDHAAVKDLYGETITNKRGITVHRIPSALSGMTKKGGEGVHPDMVAAMLGYSSGDEMVRDIMQSPKLRDLAEQNAEQIMADRHGDILNDGTIEKEADEALQNEERGATILAELKALSKGTPQATIDRKMMQTMAEENIGKLTFREINPAKYRKAEIRAAQDAAAALQKGDKTAAAEAKTRQALNFYLGKAASEAKNDVMKIVDRMGRYRKKNVREAIMKAENGYWEQLVKILDRFEFRKGATMKQVDRYNESLNEWAKTRIEEDGAGLVLSPVVLDEGYVTHWKNIRYSDLVGISDSVKNIEHVARYSNRVKLAEDERDFQQVVQQWVESMNEKVDTRFKSQRTDTTEGRKWGRWAMAQMTKIPFMASWLDGGERAGLSHQILMQPMNDAYDAELRLWGEIGTPVMELIQNRSKEDMKRHNQKLFIPEIRDENNDGNLMGHQVLAVALNVGNAGNLRKMLLGEGWAHPEREEEVTIENPKLQAVLKHMTKGDWDLVQSVWDQMDKLYPQLAEVHRRTTGLTPPKIEAVEFETQFGTYKGGYYPVKYDPNRSIRALKNKERLDAETESLFGQVGIQASVNASATNERTGYYAPIMFDLSIIPNHFQETIHYITHHDAVRQVNRLIRNESVAKTIREKLGPEEYAQLKPWLNDVAKDGREQPMKTFWGSILQRLRFGTTLGVMGFKASTGIIQTLGLSNTMAEVGSANTYQAIRSILGSKESMRESWEFAVANSKVMAHRMQTMDREIRNAMQKIEGKHGLLAAAQEASMKHIALIQTYLVDLPTWHAAYIKGMKDWGDETRAYQYADWAVENIQGSGVTKDMAQVFRNQSQEARMFTMFMTFFSALWNMERDVVKGARGGVYSKSSVAAKMMFLFTIPVFLEMALKGDLGGDDGDDDTTLQKYLTNLALYPVQSVPFFRDIASGVIGDYGYNISPIAQMIEAGTRSIPELIIRQFTDDDITKGQVKGASKLIGAALGIPGVSQAWATGEHLYNVLVEGEDLTIHELIYGPERNK